MTLAAMLGVTAARADTKAGYDLWQRGDYIGAVTEWRPLAIAGDADAQYNLAQAYKLGRGVPLDLKTAEGWYARAAAQGNVSARDNYGLILFQNGDRQASLPYIEEAAKRGEPRAQYVLGTALFNGDMVKKDWLRAYALMTRASAAGIAAASASLAQMDKYIPLDQRQRGLTLARTMEVESNRPQFAARDVRPGAIRRATLPPPRLPVTPAPAATSKPRLAVKSPSAPRSLPVERDVEQVLERPGIAPAKPVLSGKWRVQLGAYSSVGKVQTAWAGLRARVPALGPYRLLIVNAGVVSRLQVGPLPSRAAAQRLCASVLATGAACLPVGS